MLRNNTAPRCKVVTEPLFGVQLLEGFTLCSTILFLIADQSAATGIMKTTACQIMSSKENLMNVHMMISSNELKLFYN